MGDAWQALVDRQTDGMAMRIGDEIPAGAALLDLVQAMADRPMAIGQIGQTLDGRVATVSGHSHYVNGEGALDHLHRLRALVDAVLIGGATLAMDDPLLTTRRVTGPNPVRVVLDPSGRALEDRKLFTDGQAPTLVVGPYAPGRSERLDCGASPDRILAALRERGLRSVLIEGGPRTLSAFLRAGALDRLHLLMAPKILGSGKPGILLPEAATMASALTPQVSTYPVGDDLLFDCRFTAPVA
ncbi:MAG: RibD family protein [Alphaproteobacteria bacterium]|nr:RibD family protein [Alphaproteobacteria bacterium]